MQAAGALLRARGVDGVSVADVMAAAGMTQGGFYTHFESKERLVEEAFDQASRESVQTLRRIAEEAPEGRGLLAMVDAYLSAAHCADPAHGCVLAAHAGDSARQGKGFRRAFTAAIYRVLESLTEAASHDELPLRRQEALSTIALLVGALTLARATDDEALVSELLTSATAATVRSRSGTSA